ncbi:MAG: hypothetical protein LQ339_004339 [Xanthoria mediterranea]|nr:MAG: hypothetical protein LQ339_004339 [Xanthoria mediterranea]
MDPSNSGESNYSSPSSSVNGLSGVWNNDRQMLNISSGLRNPTGARCYFNSVVIALLHFPKFVSWLEEHEGGHRDYQSCAACILELLSSAYWDEKPDQNDLKHLIDAFITAINSVDNGWKKQRLRNHEDAQEFYQWLMVHLHQQDTRNERIKKLHGLLSSVTKTCSECDKKEISTEFNWQLILSCHGNADIEQALAQYFAPEKKDGIECDSETCKQKKVSKTYSREVRRGPEILCTQFNRFMVVKPMPGRENIRKDNRKVIYSNNLTLQPVKNGEILRYTLLAAIHHQGTMNEGHYITVTKTPAGAWVRHNNEMVETVDLQAALQPTDNFTPYLLFWQKDTETPKSPNKRGRPSDDEVDPESPPSKKAQNSRAPSPNYEPSTSPKPPTSTLSECEKERKNLKSLVDHAAMSHADLIDSARSFHFGLSTALNLLATLHPLMEELKNKKGFRDRAADYLKYEREAHMSRIIGVSKAQESSNVLFYILTAADPAEERKRCREFRAYFHMGRKKIEEGGLHFWLCEELDLKFGREGEDHGGEDHGGEDHGGEEGRDDEGRDDEGRDEDDVTPSDG